MSKPVILLDCDGVLADFTSLALKYIEEETGKKYQVEDVPRWDVFESLGYPELWEKFGKAANATGVCANIKPYVNAFAGVKNLQKEYNVVIVTAPVDALPWMYERVHWLEENFEIPRKNVIFAHEKHHVKGAVFVDDKPENVFNWHESNPEGLAVLWEHPFNESVELPCDIVRTSDWDDLFLRTKDHLK